MKDSSAAAEAENTGCIITKPTNKGSFSFTIPLKHISEFTDNYDKIVYGPRRELSLVRDSDANAILRDAVVKLNKISLFVSHVTSQTKIRIECTKSSNNVPRSTVVFA